MLIGLGASYRNSQNGMTWHDMSASARVAQRRREVIVFRSTGPWSKRWLEAGHPSKNFHVKGKSSDWGPQAGLVPYDGIYSKVGADAEKAKKGTKANIDGIHSGFADKRILRLSQQMLDIQRTVFAGDPKRTAIKSATPIIPGNDLVLVAERSGDKAPFLFLAKRSRIDGMFEIYAFDKSVTSVDDAVKPDASKAVTPLEVMVSNEKGAQFLPMTGDYDLFAVCPLWADYGSPARSVISKPAIELNTEGHGKPKGQEFVSGHNMDKVIDAHLHTMQNIKTGPITKGMPAYTQRPSEHPDMGNLTPRILDCINSLNNEMGAVGKQSAVRRVHHNAESHRHANFAALTEKDMTEIKTGERYGDGFPLTVFQPADAGTDVVTLENFVELGEYANLLHDKGYYVPRNWVWNMGASWMKAQVPWRSGM